VSAYLRHLVLRILIGWPSRALWLLRTKRDPLEVLQDQAERKFLRRPDTAGHSSDERPRFCAVGASGYAMTIRR
jgi:hypothetical protein